MFTTLKDEDLVSIGIRSFGARKMMLNAIQGKIFSVSYGDPLLSFGKSIETVIFFITRITPLIFSQGTWNRVDSC
jgi:hypothetical protein